MNYTNRLPATSPAIPLSLYIHFPWCLSKCSYCDFNSHAVTDKSFFATYIDKLLIDLDTTAPEYANRELVSIYFGGGTPSLLPPAAVARILQKVQDYFSCPSGVEVTLEANPGTIDLGLCQEFKSAGINRLSIGVQSFNDLCLKNVQRNHNGQEAIAAIEAAKLAGFVNFNLDFMFGLTGQTIASAVADLTTALSFAPPHLSWYQLTLASNFLSSSFNDKCADYQQYGQEVLFNNGFHQYEVSAYCQAKHYRCKHNINYWQFGDYAAIGAGAHGKLTFENYTVKRYAKVANPYKYLQLPNLIEHQEIVPKEKLPLEFMLNALRLYQPISYDLFQSRTGSPISVIDRQLDEAIQLELITLQDNTIITTPHGRNFLNNLLEIFL